MLNVYKASAGSGKTFQLVYNYLVLLFKNPNNYKHILAVTFTNKATNEMKSRILEHLNELANGKKSDYLDDLMNKLNSDEKEIRKKAGEILQNILHDYNRFSVNTIDSFTQKVIKNFNRELGISPNYNLELDNEMILAEATDRLMQRIGDDSDLFKWLIDFSSEKIKESKSRKLEREIKYLGLELFKEKFQVFFPDEGETVYNKTQLAGFTKILKKEMAIFETELKKIAKTALVKIEAEQLDFGDFSGGAGRSVPNTFKKIINNNFSKPTKTAYEATTNADKWVTKNNKNRESILNLVKTTLQPLLANLIKYYDLGAEKYNTAKVVLEQIRTLGILTDLKEEIKILLHEKGSLQLSDSNLLLSKIIGHTDTPFVYEKTGTFYKHFMLDEFQDTSGLQWNNFRPLISNSLAEGNENLLVGDVKQSIYRWRNSDWHILAQQIHTDFKGQQLAEISLAKNWRSSKNIIEFNNQVIAKLKEQFKTSLFDKFSANRENYEQQFDDVYSDFYQEPGNPDLPEEGYISANFIVAVDFEQASVSKLVDQIKHLQNNGIKASETAILTRTNKEGQLIIEEFLKATKLPENKGYNLTVLSNESLFLKSSKAVRFCVGLVEYIVSPENEVNQAKLLHLWNSWLQPKIKNLTNPENSETKLKNTSSVGHDFQEQFKKNIKSKTEQLKAEILHTSLDETITLICAEFGLFEFENELPFLQTLIDKATELKMSLSNDLSNFIFWWNESGAQVSVNVNENIDSVRLLTVHKSKGLEFTAVLIPFLNWPTFDSHNPILWCTPKTSPFNFFPLLPVKSKTDVANTGFKKEYFDEIFNNFIDVINLIYVAFTRAKSVLVFNSKPFAENKNGKEKTEINNLLWLVLDKLNSHGKFAGSFNSDETEFTFGKFPTNSQSEESQKQRLINKYAFNRFSEKLKLRYSAEDFLIDDQSQTSGRNLGKIIHEIMAGIKTINDIENACDTALRKGKINSLEFETIREQIKTSLVKPEVKPWFDGTLKVLNETDLLTPEKILRPDRIMIQNNKAIVVDYKTGESKSDNYNSQVKRYAKTLKETGFEKVEGFLWYINLNHIEKVCEY